jgi:endonuclease-3
MGLARQDQPERIEAELMRAIPQDEWIAFGPALVLHGRYVCTAKRPKCDECRFAVNCEKRDVE